MKKLNIAVAFFTIACLSNNLWAAKHTYGNEDYNITATQIDTWGIRNPWKGRKITHYQHQGVSAEGFDTSTHLASLTTWLGNYDDSYHYNGTEYLTRNDGVYKFKESLTIKMFGVTIGTFEQSESNIGEYSNGTVLKMTNQIKAKSFPMTVVIGFIPFSVVGGMSADFTFDAKLDVPAQKGPGNEIKKLDVDHSFEPSFTVKAYATLGPALSLGPWTLAESGVEGNLVLLEGKYNRGFVLKTNNLTWNGHINESVEINVLKGQLVLYAQMGIWSTSIRQYELELASWGGFNAYKWQNTLIKAEGTRPW